MADKAFLILDDGQKVEVEAARLNENDKGKKYVCCGTPRGQPCTARMSLVTPRGRENYFAAMGDQHHRRFCKYDESTEYGKIGYIDPTGANTSPNDLLKSFNRKRATAGGGGGAHGGSKTRDIDSEQESEESIRRIRRVPDKPHNLKDLVLTLNSLDVDDIFGGVRVGDFFLDHRSIRAARKKGLPEEHVAIVICGKTAQGKDLRCGDNSIVLVDGFYYEQRASAEKLFFVVNTDPQGLRKIFNSSKEDKIAILAKWHHHPERKDAYVSEYISDGCIEIISSSHFQV